MAPKYTKALFAGTLVLLASTLVAGTADLQISASSVRPIGYVDPGTPMSYDFRVRSGGPDPASPRVTVQLPAGAQFVSVADPSWQCSASATGVVCNHAPIVKDEEAVITVNIVAPTDPRGIWTTLHAHVESDLPDPHPELADAYQILVVYRSFVVDTPDDFGAGSLRVAIESANAACDASVPCKIRFARAMRIVPRSPLPALAGCGILVDGGVYDIWTPTPNRYLDLPRRVEIAGDGLESGSGLLVDSSCRAYLGGFTLSGLAIGGFPENGIELRDGELAVQGCFIGTDATGTTAVPNRLRGIAMDAPTGFLSVSDSLVAGNARSGVAVYNADTAQFYGNLIGVRFGGIPMPNGASGVYLAAVRQARFDRDAIEYNREFGIAIGPGAQHVASDGDYIAGNGGLAIDWGLDGPSGDRVPIAPHITDAVFDPAQGVTIVSGFFLLANWPLPLNVRVYLTDGDYQGGLLLRGQKTTITRPGGLAFQTVVPGDWRGRRISAQTLYYPDSFNPFIDSSEFSASILVR